MLAVIGVGFRPFHVHIATAQAMVEIMEDTDLQMAAVSISVILCRVLMRAQRTLAKSRAISGEQGPGGVLIALNILERRDEGLVVRGTAEHQQVG